MSTAKKHLTGSLEWIPLSAISGLHDGLAELLNLLDYAPLTFADLPSGFENIFIKLLELSPPQVTRSNKSGGTRYICTGGIRQLELANFVLNNPDSYIPVLLQKGRINHQNMQQRALAELFFQPVVFSLFGNDKSIIANAWHTAKALPEGLQKDFHLKDLKSLAAILGVSERSLRREIGKQ